MTDLLTAQLPLIKAAAAALESKPVCTYARLRQLLDIKGAQARTTFEAEFTGYYGLKSGGVTPRFREIFFDRLYALRGKAIGEPTYARLLRELYEIPRHKRDKALPCSFVSKLIAIHDESRPLFDRYVSRFFGSCGTAIRLTRSAYRRLCVQSRCRQSQLSCLDRKRAISRGF